MAEKVKVNMFMSPDLLAKLKHLAKLQDVSYSEVIRAACRDYIVANRERLERDAVILEMVK